MHSFQMPILVSFDVAGFAAVAVFAAVEEEHFSARDNDLVHARAVNNGHIHHQANWGLHDSS